MSSCVHGSGISRCGITFPDPHGGRRTKCLLMTLGHVDWSRRVTIHISHISLTLSIAREGQGGDDLWWVGGGQGQCDWLAAGSGPAWSGHTGQLPFRSRSLPTYWSSEPNSGYRKLGVASQIRSIGDSKVCKHPPHRPYSEPV